MLLQILMWTLLAAVVVMLLAPDSALGKAVREKLVDAPARFLLDMTWTKAARVSTVAAIFLLLVLSGPEMMAMLFMAGGDFAAVELLLVVWAVAASGALTAFRGRVTGGARRIGKLVRRGLRRSSARQARRRKTGANRPDSEDEPGWAFA
jgi:hypothetical protein